MESTGIALNNLFSIAWWNIAVNMNYDIFYIIIYFFVFLWIISIIWVVKDISYRTSNLFYQIFCILLITFLSPLVGLPLYFIVRPLFYKHDKLAWRESLLLEVNTCYNCNTINHKDNIFCIACGEKIQTKCKECKHTYCSEYDYCPICWAPNIDN